MAATTSFIDISWPQLPQRDLWRSNIPDGDGDVQMSLESGSTNDPPHSKPFSILELHDSDDKRAAPVHQPGGCEYLDHTADVQLHTWGPSRATSYAAAVVGLHEYMVDAPNAQATHHTSFQAKGHDEHSLLYAVLDEALFLFASEGFVIKRAQVTEIDDKDFRHAKVEAWGYYFVHGNHPQGTEVKAITYSNMQVVEKKGAVHLYVIVDI